MKAHTETHTQKELPFGLYIHSHTCVHMRTYTHKKAHIETCTQRKSCLPSSEMCFVSEYFCVPQLFKLFFKHFNYFLDVVDITILFGKREMKRNTDAKIQVKKKKHKNDDHLTLCLKIIFPKSSDYIFLPNSALTEQPFCPGGPAPGQGESSSYRRWLTFLRMTSGAVLWTSCTHPHRETYTYIH